MTTPEQGPRNRYERAAELDQQREREFARNLLSQPMRPFLAKQLAWGAAGFAFGLILGSWTWAIVNFVVFTAAGFLAREFVRRRYAKKDTNFQTEPPPDSGADSA